ncbi:MAG: hypothetical protein GY946_04170 [bacterium]|nr:hypothetical protein [bacterium]
MMFIRGIAACFLILLSAAVADAGDHRIRGRIVDADGNGVPDIGVAGAWTKTTDGLTPLEGVQTDDDGRFLIVRKAESNGVLLIAFDEDGHRGALIEISRDKLAEEVSATLYDCATVKGRLGVAGTKFYPSGARVWMSTARPSTAILRIEPESGDFEFRLPPGAYELTAHGPGLTPERRSFRLDAMKTQSLGKLELSKHEGRVATGALAPAIRYAEASPSVVDALRQHHFPRRLTLCYFWASR